LGENLIYCFSGTGNSLAAAKQVAAVLGGADIRLMKGASAFEGGRYRRIGFVFPSYAGGVPRAVLAYIGALGLTADAADYFFTVVTCGGAPRNTLPMLRDALAQKGIPLHYGKSLNTVGNYIVMYPLRQDAANVRAAADAQMEDYAREIAANTTTDIGKVTLSKKLFYKVGNRYFRMNAKKHAASRACTACGLCARLCPMGCIQMQAGKPAFDWKSCAQCMACIQWCPTGAVNCGKETLGRTRYHHPDIRAEELI